MTTAPQTRADPIAADALRPHAARWPALAGLHARTFARERSTAAMLPVPFVAVAALWLVAFGMLAAGLGRTDPAGRALALVLPPRPRAPEAARLAAVGLAGALGVFGLVALAGVSASPAGYGLLAVLVALAAPAARTCLRGRAARARLRQGRPPGPHWVVSGVCRAPDAPGAGAGLIASLCRAADDASVALCLEAIAPPLVAYYERFGFRPTGPAEELPGGAVVTPMGRPPEGLADA